MKGRKNQPQTIRNTLVYSISCTGLTCLMYSNVTLEGEGAATVNNLKVFYKSTTQQHCSAIWDTQLHSSLWSPIPLPKSAAT